MNTQPLSNNLPKPKRPLSLTLMCIVYLFLISWQLVESLTPSGYLAAIAKIPSWYVVMQILIFYPLGIVSMIGVWLMRKWGITLFFSSVLLSWVMMIFGLRLLPNEKALALLFVFLIVTLKYFYRMR